MKLKSSSGGENVTKRFWVSWWSGYYEDEGCTRPPFQVWISGERSRRSGERTDCSICAVIDARTEAEIWPVVNKHFPGYEARFCEERSLDYDPSIGGRFPGFENKTSLV